MTGGPSSTASSSGAFEGTGRHQDLEGQVSLGNVAVELALRVFGGARRRARARPRHRRSRPSSRAGLVSRGAAEVSVASAHLRAPAPSPRFAGASLTLADALRQRARLRRHHRLRHRRTRLLDAPGLRELVARRHGVPCSSSTSACLGTSTPPPARSMASICRDLDDLAEAQPPNLRRLAEAAPGSGAAARRRPPALERRRTARHPEA
jgi:hypothetical protein